MDTSTDALSGVLDHLADLDHPDQSTGAFAAELSRISDHLANVMSEHIPALAGTTAEETVAAVGTVEAISRLVDAAQVMLAGRIQELCDPTLGDESLAHRYGCRNETEVLQRATRAPARTLTKRLRLATRVAPRHTLSGEYLPPRAPGVAQAFTAGDVSLECATLITTMLERSDTVAPPEMVEIAERVLVDTATGGAGELPVHDDDMRTYCQVWGARLDQDGPEPNDTCTTAKRWFRFGREHDGLVPISGALLPDTAALLGRLCDAVNSPKTRTPVRFVPTDTGTSTDTSHRAGTSENHTNGSPTSGSPTTSSSTASGVSVVPDATSAAPSPTESTDIPDVAELIESAHLDPRSGDQKRHDALATILAATARHPDTPLLGGAPVTVLIQTRHTDLHHERGTGWIHGHDGALTPVPLSTVRHAACAGATQRVLQDDTGKILELGTLHRVFNAHQRRAITLRDGGCVIPGCTIPGTWCEIHHVTEHARGGATHTNNGVLLCWYHHRSLDTSGWVIRMNDGTPEIQPPDWIDPQKRWYQTGSPLRTPNPHTPNTQTATTHTATRTDARGVRPRRTRDAA